jgi:hypothetical protein
MTAPQVLNTKGAARRLGCSETWIHKLVAKGALKAYAYDDNGELVEHMKDTKRQGQGFYFLASDVDGYRPAVQRRPRGSKNKPSVPRANTRTA